MRLLHIWLAFALAGASVATAMAQHQGATTVQLPTFSYFSGSTTVSVPDRGGVYLGGVNRAASGRNEFGVPLLPFRPFRNSAFGGERSASSMHVTATIHDFEAMDEFLLSQPTPARTPQILPPWVAAQTRTLPAKKPAAPNSWQLAAPAVPPGVPATSLAAEQARRASQRNARSTEAVNFFQLGQKAEAAGKTGAAKVYYQMAARRATGELKDQATAKLDAILRAQTTSKIAGAVPNP